MNLLSVGGSDPSGASGVQRDARVAWVMGMHHLSVITAVTAQNTFEFAGAEPVDTQLIHEQLCATLSDFEISAAKVGMLWSADIIRAVVGNLLDVGFPVVVDPVVRSTTGGALLEPSARSVLLQRMVPLADVMTPNIREAEYLTGMDISDVDSAAEAAKDICGMGASAAVVTGVVAGDKVADVLYDGEVHIMYGRLLKGGHRGGGCTFSALLACHMAAGLTPREAAVLAGEQTHTAVLDSLAPGTGRRVAADPRGRELALAVDRLAGIPGVAELVPECQTNFVHADAASVSPDQVLGVEGRLVRAGGRMLRAGSIRPGGSRHVASAVCAIRSEFPELLSAANIRYSPDIVAAMIKEGLAVAFYDRSEEPSEIKESGSSVAWGVSVAAAGSPTTPDVVCHRGDFGKEPMSIVFGATPDEVVSKVRRISKRLRQEGV